MPQAVVEAEVVLMVPKQGVAATSPASLGALALVDVGLVPAEQVQALLANATAVVDRVGHRPAGSGWCGWPSSGSG